MLFVSGIVTPLGAPEETAVEKALSALRLKRGAVRECYVSKTSVDARRKGEIHIVSTVALRLKEDEASFAAASPGKKSSVRLQYKPDTAFTVPHGEKPCKTPVVVAGFGPRRYLRRRSAGEGGLPGHGPRAGLRDGTAGAGGRGLLGGEGP